MAKFKEIKQFTRTPSYQVDVPWDYIEETLERYNDAKRGGSKLQMDPDFQRAHVWTEAQQVAFVEFCLQGGRSGQTILWNAKGWMRGFEGDVVLVDGKQRMEAIRKFLRGDLAVFGGQKRSDFTDRLPSSLTLRFMINDLPTHEQVLKWYLELNTGGTPHTEEEIEKVRAMLAEGGAK